MCTVTFIPAGDTIYIASNRDEHVQRKTAQHPVAEQFSTGKILFPRDREKGGTWIGVHANGNMMVLLNGGFERHERKQEYRRSRGLIFLDVFDAAHPSGVFNVLDLEDIEPFTLVVWQASDGELKELRWDGLQKHEKVCDAAIPHIWSSVTLYDKEVIAKRKLWFENWLRTTNAVNANALMQFHEFGGEGDAGIDLKMNRAGILKTVSITLIESNAAKLTMQYRDMLTGTLSVNEWLRNTIG